MNRVCNTVLLIMLLGFVIGNLPFAVYGINLEQRKDIENQISELIIQLNFLKDRLRQERKTIVRFNSVLSRGSTGVEVKLLQQYLNQERSTQVALFGPGSPGQETEVYGVATEQAVARLQRNLGIEQTGSFNNETRIVINGKSRTHLVRSSNEDLKDTEVVQNSNSIPLGDSVRFEYLDQDDLVTLIDSIEETYRVDLPAIQQGRSVNVQNSEDIMQGIMNGVNSVGSLVEAVLSQPFGGTVRLSYIPGITCSCVNPAYFPNIALFIAPIIQLENVSNRSNSLIRRDIHLAFFPNVTDLFGLDLFSKSYLYHTWAIPGVRASGTYYDSVRLTCMVQAPQGLCVPHPTIGRIDGMIRMIGSSMLPRF
jgi:peptidoglycan hydrolase-like protein with peptidoglycan-binding domain